MAKLNAAFNAAQKTPAVAKTLASDDSDVFFASPAEITARIKADYERMAEVVRKFNMKFE